jgi:hypothetical protein
MAQPSSYLGRFRSELRDLLDAWEIIKARLDEHDALGGPAFLSPFFLDADGNPRKDLDISAADVDAAVTVLKAVHAAVTQHGPSLYRLRG